MSLIWKTTEEMDKELATEAATRDRDKYGNDGHVSAATGTFEYKGIKYIINVARYYNLNYKDRPTQFLPMSSRKSEYFVNLEYPEEEKTIVEVVKLIHEYSEFLWNDTLHSYADNMDVNEQIEKMHQCAREDIDSLAKLDEEIDAKIKALEEVKQTLREKLSRGYI